MKNKEDQFREIFEQSPMGITFHDKRGNVTYIKSISRDIFNIIRGSALDINLCDHPEFNGRKDEIIKIN